MTTTDKETIRTFVRQRYGKLARGEKKRLETDQPTPGFGPTPIARETFQMASCCGSAKPSTESTLTGSCCGAPEPSAGKMAKIMGYSEEALDSIPDGANMGLGCGNPVALASLKPGETVVDLGSGGGFDCFLAAQEVGETGKVIGVDMTPDMLTKARENAKKMAVNHVEFRLGEIEHLPVADNTADIIMSNCVINLSPDKLLVYRDAFRVLKPGGRLAISDIVATAPLPEKIRNDLALVGACVGGAATIDETMEMLKTAGFQDIRIKPKDNSRELFREWDPKRSEQAVDYVVSAYIEAVKPSGSAIE